MAIGVKISSENLMGETVSIVFNPLSGGTIDLGVQTIPYNYINSVPYGTYLISSSTYNYVYTLNVTEPYGQSQSYGQLGNVSGDTNFSVASLNFDTFTADIVNLAVDSSYWNISSWYMITNYGYMFIFMNYGINDRLVLFTDINFNIIEQYQSISTNYDYGTLDGRICYFNDNTNGVMKYYNGVDVFDYTYSAPTEVLDIQYDWDGSCLDGTFIFTIFNSSNSMKYSYKALYNGSVLPISNWDNTIEYKRYGCYYSSNYFYELTSLQLDYTISDIKIYDTSGNVYGFPSIAANTYDNWNLNWYGNQSFNIILYNNSNINTDYYILNFDGITQNVINTTHTRGINYQYYNSWYDTNFFPQSQDNGGIFMIFHGPTNTYSPGGGYEVGYLDILYKLENDLNYTLYTFTNTGSYDKTFEMNIYTGGYKNFYSYCSTGDSQSQIFYIGSEGVKFIPTGQNISIDGQEYGIFGDKFFLIQKTNSYTIGNLNLLKDGEIINSETFDTNNSWSYIYDYDTFYIYDINKAFYFNNSVTGLTTTDIYDNFYDSYSYYTPYYYKRNGDIVLYNSDNSLTRVLSKDKISNEFYLPIPNGNYDIRVGKDKFLYVYNDVSNNTRINLYNFDGALLNSVLSFPNWNDLYAGKDRYVVKQNTIDAQILLTMISENNYNQITLDNDLTSWWNINDYILWD